MALLFFFLAGLWMVSHSGSFFDFTRNEIVIGLAFDTGFVVLLLATSFLILWLSLVRIARFPPMEQPAIFRFFNDAAAEGEP